MKRTLDILIGILVLFGVYSSVSWITIKVEPSYSVFLPSGFEIFASFASLINDPSFWAALVGTYMRIVLSLTLAVFAGLLLGITLGSRRWIYERVRPSWDFLRSIPPSTLFPLVVLFFGIGNDAKVFTTFFFATLLYSYGVAETARSAAESLGPFYRLVGVSSKDWYLRVLLPDVVLKSVPTLKLVVSLTVILMIVCEMFLGSVAGIGAKIITAAEGLRFGELLALISVSGLIGYSFNLALQVTEDIADRRSK